MGRLIMMLAAFILAVTHVHAGDWPEQLEGFDAKYKLRRGPLSVSVTMQLLPDEQPGEFRYSVTNKAKGLAKLFVKSGAGESTRFALEDGQPRPLEYRRTDGSGKDKGLSQVSFDWQDALAYATHDGAEATVDIVPGMHDRLTADIAAMLDLRSGRRLVSYDLIDRNTIRTYLFEELGSENIETAAGPLETVKYRRQREGSSRSVLIWYAPELGYLPVRVEQQKDGETTFTMALERIPPQEAVVQARNQALGNVTPR